MSASQNVEMNDVKDPLMGESNIDKAPEVEFKGSKQDFRKETEEFHGLTKEELEKFAKDPFWRKLRIILFVLFWVVWVGMLIAAILIVIMSPKCPKKPKLEFWEQDTGYWVDPFAFGDTDQNGVGDFKGILSKLNYIEKQLGAGYIILDPIFNGQYSSFGKRSGLVKNFREFDPKVGDKESFVALVKDAQKRGIEIVLTADFNALICNSTFLDGDKKSLLIPWDDRFSSWSSRNGKRPARTINGVEYYSAVESEYMCELNLKNETVVKEIKESVKMWLELGVRGFVLTNIGMYVENADIPATATSYKINNTWYDKRSLNGQIYSNETQLFLKEIRATMDEVAKKTDRSRLLIVDAGDIGFGLDGQDELLRYLGDNGKLADMIIGREFVKNRGWQPKTYDDKISSVKNYMDMVPMELRKKVALTSATSTNIRSNNLLDMAAPFLVAGNPILYYGSELGLVCDIKTINSEILPFYPTNRIFGINEELPSKCNHMIMPWDNSGKGFFNNTLYASNSYVMNQKPTVQSLTAIGIGETVLQLHQKLIKLRKDHSLQSGQMTMIIDAKTASHSYEIFTRQLEGFPTVIVALLRDTLNDGKVFSFDSICSKFIPLLVYPSNGNLPEGKEIESKNVYLQINKAESVHVFKCA